MLLVAYLFGGYVAGRMARRAGWLNGLAVFMLAGSVLGGILGERWHGKQPPQVHTETRTGVDRADPDVHPQETTGGMGSRTARRLGTRRTSSTSGTATKPPEPTAAGPPAPTDPLLAE